MTDCLGPVKGRETGMPYCRHFEGVDVEVPVPCPECDGQGWVGRSVETHPGFRVGVNCGLCHGTGWRDRCDVCEEVSDVLGD